MLASGPLLAHLWSSSPSQICPPMPLPTLFISRTLRPWGHPAQALSPSPFLANPPTPSQPHSCSGVPAPAWCPRLPQHLPKRPICSLVGVGLHGEAGTVPITAGPCSRVCAIKATALRPWLLLHAPCVPSTGLHIALQKCGRQPPVLGPGVANVGQRLRAGQSRTTHRSSVSKHSRLGSSAGVKGGPPYVTLPGPFGHREVSSPP